MANTSNPKNVKELLRRLDALEPHGVTVERGARQHFKVRLRGRVVATLPSTPSDVRTILNCCSDLRRGGVDIRNMLVTA